MSDVLASLVNPLEERFAWKGLTDEQEMAAKADMIRSFENFSDEVLKRAAQWIREHRKFSSMPTVGDIRDVIDRIAAERPKGAGEIPSADEPGNGWRLSASGSRYYRIERGTPEWSAWMGHYRSTGNKKMADFVDKQRDPHFVNGQWPPGHSGDPGDEPRGESDGRFTKLAYGLIRSDMGRRAAEEGWILGLFEFIETRGRLPSGEPEIWTLRESARGLDDAYAECARGGWDYAEPLRKLGDSMLERRNKLAAIALGEAQREAA